MSRAASLPKGRLLACCALAWLVAVWCSPVQAATQVAQPLACRADALVQARKLLAFHSDGDDRAEVDETTIKALPWLRNPANPKQRFLVLEVMGFVYKGNYRMRLIYYPSANPSANDCVLMGQEILELANL